jgi:hypothetical protein
VRYGRERAAARVLEVVEDDADDGGLVAVGDDGTIEPPTALDNEPCLGFCWRRNCKAFASAFSWVRTKWARLLMNKFPSSLSIIEDACGLLRLPFLLPCISTASPRVADTQLEEERGGSGLEVTQR